MAEEDLIFGKNRHFFGGIEPSNMKKIEVSVNNGIVQVNAQLPDDTVVNGQTLCSVAGAVIRRKSGEYPVDEFDGDLVADISESCIFVDNTADPTMEYLYAAFPYSTQGVYNISPVNRSGINIPDPMVSFEVEGSSSSVKIIADLPDTAVGAVIRRSTTGYPVSEIDGDECMTIYADGTYLDTNVMSDTTYYYAAFPYNSGGAYSRNIKDRAVAYVSPYWVFGYDLDTTDKDPDTRVSYPEDVDNYGFTPAAMNYSTGVFNYGSWNLEAGEKFMPRPCMLKYDGTVLHYLNPNNYGLRADGSGVSSITDRECGANAMMEWPKIYTKRWESNGIYHFRCSNIRHDAEWDCWCNYDKNDNEIDHFYTAIYMGSVPYTSTYLESNIRSLSGMTNKVSLTTTNAATDARKNGDDWYMDIYADRLLIQDLLVMMARTTDGQTAYGAGNGDPNNIIITGTMNTKGLFWGDNTDNDNPGVKVFGMEHWWGNVARMTAGLIYASAELKLKITRGTHDGTGVNDYGPNGSGNYYITVLKNTDYSGQWSSDVVKGYISGMKTTPYGRIPRAKYGSASTYECDAIYITGNTGVKYLITGTGDRNTVNPMSEPYQGPFYTDLGIVGISTKDERIGCSLSCKPSAK